jgi:transposase
MKMNINLHRLEEFRQLKKQIRGSDEYLIVGIDVAKEKHYAFFGTATGKSLLRRLIFENNITGFSKLLDRAQAFQGQEGLKRVVFGIEPTACYHKSLAEFLIKQKLPVVLIDSVAGKKNRQTLDGRWDQHDTKDAANVADMISQAKILYYDHPSMPLRELRSLLSLKRKLKKQEHSLRMRIRNHLVAQYFPEFDRYFRQCKQENLAIVKWCLNPAVIAGMEFNKFSIMVTSRDRGLPQQRRLRNIWQAAASSVGCEFGPAIQFEAKLLAGELCRIREMITATEAKIKAACRKFPAYEYLLGIPGFGPVISAMTLGAIGDPGRFHKGAQLLKLLGLDLEAKRSGKNSASMVPVISKKGKAECRYGLYQAAFIASISNQHFRQYFTNKLQGREKERGIKTKMRVKLAAKMALIAWTIMKKEEPFNPDLLNLQ